MMIEQKTKTTQQWLSHNGGASLIAADVRLTAAIDNRPFSPLSFAGGSLLPR